MCRFKINKQNKEISKKCKCKWELPRSCRNRCWLRCCRIVPLCTNRAWDPAEEYDKAPGRRASASKGTPYRQSSRFGVPSPQRSLRPIWPKAPNAQSSLSPIRRLSLPIDFPLFPCACPEIIKFESRYSLITVFIQFWQIWWKLRFAFKSSDHIQLQ